jgi:hypothetical protein
MPAPQRNQAHRRSRPKAARKPVLTRKTHLDQPNRAGSGPHRGPRAQGSPRSAATDRWNALSRRLARRTASD